MKSMIAAFFKGAVFEFLQKGKRKRLSSRSFLTIFGFSSRFRRPSSNYLLLPNKPPFVKYFPS